jgi:hypothetical protein
MFLCKHCDFFVEVNPFLDLNPKGYAVWVHATDGNMDETVADTHNAEPDTEYVSLDWSEDRADLFIEHADGHIGPNSEFHVIALDKRRAN